MVEIFGRSDDVVVIVGSAYEYDEIDCYCCDVRIWFADGTVVLVSFHDGLWHIEFEELGDAVSFVRHTVSGADMFIEAEVSTHEVIDRR